MSSLVATWICDVLNDGVDGVRVRITVTIPGGTISAHEFTFGPGKDDIVLPSEESPLTAAIKLVSERRLG